jgi:hypothetical protein
MDKKYQFQNITDKEIRAKGVQALANRPNAAQQYGKGGLTPEALKKWFDQLAELLAKRINELQNAIQGEEAAKYIGIALGEYETLDDLFLGIQDGSLARSLLRLYGNENALEPAALQDIIYGIAQSISDIEEDVQDLGDKKLAKVADAATYKRVYGVDEKGNQIMLNAAANPDAQVPLYSSNGALIAKMTPIAGMPGGEYPSEVVNLAFINELRKHIGAGVRFSMDPTTYIVSIDVVNIDGQVIYHTELDLPFESVVVGGYYDDKTKEVVFTLKDGNEIRFPVAQLVNGLVTEAKHKADIDAINKKIDAAFNAYIVDVYNLLGGDYVDYS